jgi:hypothetical protein
MLFSGVGALLLAPLVMAWSPLAGMKKLPSPQEALQAESIAEETGGIA